jgi:hypothetical protein
VVRIAEHSDEFTSAVKVVPMYTQQSKPKTPDIKHLEMESTGFVAWDQKGVVVVWSDDHRSRFSWATLRAACQCLECEKRRGA